MSTKIENMISPDYVLCYIVRFLESFENLETKAIFRILRIFFFKKEGKSWRRGVNIVVKVFHFSSTVP